MSQKQNELKKNISWPWEETPACTSNKTKVELFGPQIYEVMLRELQLQHYEKEETHLLATSYHNQRVQRFNKGNNNNNNNNNKLRTPASHGITPPAAAIIAVYRDALRVKSLQNK